MLKTIFNSCLDLRPRGVPEDVMDMDRFRPGSEGNVFLIFMLALSTARIENSVSENDEAKREETQSRNIGTNVPV